MVYWYEHFVMKPENNSARSLIWAQTELLYQCYSEDKTKENDHTQEKLFNNGL